LYNKGLWVFLYRYIIPVHALFFANALFAYYLCGMVCRFNILSLRVGVFEVVFFYGISRQNIKEKAFE